MTISAMAFRRLVILTGLQPDKPCVGFYGRNMLAGDLIRIPCLEAILSKSFTPFLALDILINSFAHEPMRSTRGTMARR